MTATVTIRGENYSIESVSDLLIASASTALEQGLTKSSAISTFAYFLKSCCPSIPDHYCRILGFSPQSEPIFAMSLDSDEIVSLHAAIVVEFLKNRINRLDSLKGENVETDKKIINKIATIKEAIFSIEGGIKRITIDALVETLDVGVGTNVSPTTVMPANTAIDNTIELREQIKMLEGQLKAVEKSKVA